MISLSYSELVKPGFMQIASALWQAQGLDAVTSRRIYCIIKAAQEGFDKAKDLNISLAKQYCEVDDKGEAILLGPPGSNMFKFVSPEREQAFNAELEKQLEDAKFIIKGPKIDFAKISNLRSFPPSCWDSLSLIVDGLPADEDDTDEKPAQSISGS